MRRAFMGLLAIAAAMTAHAGPQRAVLVTGASSDAIARAAPKP